MIQKIKDRLWTCRHGADNQKGSTLATLVIVMAILIALGTALLSVTFSGVMHRMDQQRQKTSQYIAEAGLEEAYAYLGEEVENAVTYANEYYVRTMMLNPDMEALAGDPTQRPEFEKKIQQYFKQGYWLYFQKNEGGIATRLQDKLVVQALLSGDKTEKVGKLEARVHTSIATTIGTDIDKDTSEATLDAIKLEYAFNTLADRKDVLGKDVPAKETVKTVIAITLPKYSAPYALMTEERTIKKNPLFDKAIASDKNIYVYGKNVTVNGNLFAYGQDEAGILDNDKAGGVHIGGAHSFGGIANPSSGKLTVKGNVITDRYVRLNRSSDSDPSEFHLASGTGGRGGDLFCNSLVIMEKAGVGAGAMDNAGAVIDIAGNATVMDDLEINAKKSTVAIGGNYYGFSSGQSSTATHDQSSSIVLNATDFGAAGGGSTLSIPGTLAGKKFPFKDSAGEPGETTAAFAGNYIAGTVYVNSGKTVTVQAPPAHGDLVLSPTGIYWYQRTGNETTDSFTVRITDHNSVMTDLTVSLTGLTDVPRTGTVLDSYQTGDSMSIQGNYVAYSHVLDLDALGITGPDHQAYNKLGMLTGESEGDFFTPFNVYNLVSKKRISGGTETMASLDKAKYSAYMYRQDPSLYNLGNGAVQVGMPQYSLGTSFTDTGLQSPAGTLSTATELQTFIGSEYKYYINRMNHPQEPYYLTATGVGSYTPDSKLQERLKVQDALYTAGMSAPGVTLPNSLDSGKLSVVQAPGTNTAIILQGENPGISTGLPGDAVTYSIGGDPVQGIVLAQGDIYVVGRVQYEGLLATAGNIYFLDDQTKTFTNGYDSFSMSDTEAVKQYVILQAFKGLIGLPAVEPQNVRQGYAGFWFKQDSGITGVDWPAQIKHQFVKGDVEPALTQKSDLSGFKNAVKVVEWGRVRQ